MGIGLSTAQLLLELKYLNKFKNFKNVVEIGSQEIHIKKEDLADLYEQIGLDKKLLDSHLNINNWPNHPRESAKSFYKDIGINDYTSIDLNGELNSIPLDLNNELTDKSLFNKFDLVTDFGSAEHVFNISECYKTIHKMAKVNGIIIICQTVFKGNGYFYFDRSFLEGIAAANKYKILYSGYNIRTGTKTKAGSVKQFRIPLIEDMIKILKDYDSLGIDMVLQKTEDSEFKFPYQDQLFMLKHGNTGFNRVYNRDDLSISYIPEFSLKKFSFMTLLKEIFQRVKKRLFNK